MYGMQETLNILTFADCSTATKNLLCVMCHMSCFICHKRQQPQQPYTLPLPTPPLCRVGWFAWTEIFSWGTGLFTQSPPKILLKKGFISLAIIATCSFTRSLRSTRLWVPEKTNYKMHGYNNL